MHPTLLNFGFFQIRTYGFLLALSFLLGIWLMARRARRHGIDPQYMLDLAVWIIISAVVGARLLYVVYHLGEFSNPIEVIALWHGGATFYGGLVLAVAASYAFTHRHGLSFLEVADITSPSIALGVGITRIGCFASGCCFGKPTTLPWGVTFPPSSPAGHEAAIVAQSLGVSSVALQPTQLYSSAYGFLIMGILLLLEKRLLKNGKHGATFGAFTILYGIARFTVDFFRYYEPNAHVFFNLSFNQVISVGLIALGVYLLVRPSTVRSRAVTESSA